MNKITGSSSTRETAASAHTVTEVAVKHLANQPTVGLYYVSQHVRSSVPTLAENADTLAAMKTKAQRLARNADELTECGTLLTGRLPRLCTSLLEELRSATDGLAEANAAARQKAVAAAAGSGLSMWQWSSRR